MLKLDLHIHSQYSEDGVGTHLEISKILKKKGLNGMAITDHNTVEGGLSALKVASKDFVVIPGIEISTKDGHIIALNVKENIPRSLTVEETVEKIIDMGGIPIVPHLYRSLSGIKEKKLKKIIKKVPAIEVFNSCSVLQTNLKTMKIAKKFNLGGTGGSDSHIPSFAGEAYTIIDINSLNIDSIISSIEKKKTWGEGKTLDLNYRRDRMIKSVKQFFKRGFKRI
ncbi:MAG: PHP domain-containing protein [Candidatus Thermoplasmatota archaeon]|nr:PHP domain-containing protein [Candidatus Thermoplasmatota archaeon]